MHCPADKSPKYNDQVPEKTAEWAKRLLVHLKSLVPFYPILIAEFLHPFQISCDNDGIDESAVMWLIQYFVNKYAAGAQTAQFSVNPKWPHDEVKEGIPISFIKVLEKLRQTPRMKSLQKLTVILYASRSHYECLHWNLSTCSGWRSCVFSMSMMSDEYMIQGTFVEGLLHSICHRMRSYWSH